MLQGKDVLGGAACLNGSGEPVAQIMQVHRICLALSR
jgi:hypothetical protein